MWREGTRHLLAVVDPALLALSMYSSVSLILAPSSPRTHFNAVFLPTSSSLRNDTDLFSLSLLRLLSFPRVLLILGNLKIRNTAVLGKPPGV